MGEKKEEKKIQKLRGMWMSDTGMWGGKGWVGVGILYQGDVFVKYEGKWL